MRRRAFLQQLSTATAYIAVGGWSLRSFALSGGTSKVTILHTNDVHSHVDPFGALEGKYANKGGVARRATLIDALRKQNPNTLLLDAGDIFQGTPYFNYYGGALEFELMSKLKYDAATLGNHDFDNAIDGLYAQLPHATFDFIVSNYDFSNTVMNTHTEPYKIYQVGGFNIGVFGLGIDLSGLVNAALYKETKYLDPIEITKDMTRILKTEKQCDLVICLSHLGYHYADPSKISDLKLAASTKDIDLIIGGHTHTFLPRPTVVRNCEGKQMLVNQVGCYGINLGKIDFYFDTDDVLAKGTSIAV